MKMDPLPARLDKATATKVTETVNLRNIRGMLVSYLR